MISNQNSYADCRSKIVEAYKNWNIGLLSDTISLSEAGICIEQILKACVLLIVPRTDLEIEDFNITIYTLLKKKNYFETNHDLGSKTFGIKGCIDLIKGNKSNIVLPKEVEVFIYDLNKIYNTHKHAIKKGDPISEEISAKLYYVVDWFFKTSEEPHWKKDFYEDVDVFIENFTSRFAGKTADKIVEGLRKDYARNDIIIKNEDKIKKTIFNIRIYWVAGIICLFILAITILNRYKKSNIDHLVTTSEESPYFDTTKNSYNVLLLKFDTLNESTLKNTHIEETIKGRLIELGEIDNLNLQVKFNKDYIVTTVKKAEWLGKKFGADLVVWGDLYESDNQARLRYVNVNNFVNGILNKSGETQIETFKGLSEIKEGKLQKDIDYIIYWISALNVYNAGYYHRAISYFNKVEKINNTNKDLHFYLGNSYFNAGNFIKAQKHYEKALVLDSQFVLAHSNYGTLLSEKFNDFSGAKKQYELALSNDSNCFDVNYNYGLLLINHFQNPILAKYYFEKLLKLGQPRADLLIAYSQIMYTYFKDTILTKQLILKAIQLEPSYPDAYYSYGTFLFSRDKNSAMSYFIKCIQLDSSYSLAFVKIALIYQQKNNFIAAEKYYQKALRIDSISADAHYFYSKFLYLKKDYTQARIHCIKVAEMLDKNDNIISECAQFLYILKDIKEAYKYSVKAYNINNNNFIANLNLAYIYIFYHELSKAKVFYIKAKKLQPKNPELFKYEKFVERFYENARTKNIPEIKKTAS